jgi:hypothetical protein
MLIIWTRDDKPQGSVWGRDPKDAALDKETWRVLNAIRCVFSIGAYRRATTTRNDIADVGSQRDLWRGVRHCVVSHRRIHPHWLNRQHGSHLLHTDNVCVREIADRNHYVQGVYPSTPIATIIFLFSPIRNRSLTGNHRCFLGPDKRIHRNPVFRSVRQTLLHLDQGRRARDPSYRQ